jgi:6-phosphogluconolactonase
MVDGLSLNDAARVYAEEVAKFFGADFPQFDVVLLGVGPDAHVASLFPGLPGVLVTGQTVIPVRDSPKPPSERVSLSLPSINSARRVWVVASGADKAEAIHLAVTANDANVAPVSAVRGTEETTLYLDTSAASQLDT